MWWDGRGGEGRGGCSPVGGGGGFLVFCGSPRARKVLNCLSCRADSSQEGEEGEEFECYPPGMKVQVRYGRGRNQKTYEATVKESDLEGGEVLYLVHYCGWNVR